MTYIALARKWRPRTFSQLVGQDHINKALINSLNQNRLHHAYLFTGTRGVGKTSVARLLAKSLNCEQGISAEPCLQCNACEAIEQGRFIDLVEIDGASRTRVEDTRELLDNVQYAPTSGRFKIYLIDEVHMLSQHSFNALLKTLEEPPAHVKFILATTDPQKLPVTVLSRCLQFNLKHLQANAISTWLQQVLTAEQFTWETEAVDLVANAARGSMRDALSLLDQILAGCKDQLTTHDVRECLGYTHQNYAIQILNALLHHDPAQLMSISQKIGMEGGHYRYVLDELLGYLHQIAINQSLSGNAELLSHGEDIRAFGNQFSPEDIHLFYQIAVKGAQELHLAPTISIGFDMTLLRIYTFKPAGLPSTPRLAYQVKAEPNVATGQTGLSRATQDCTIEPEPEPELELELEPELEQETDSCMPNTEASVPEEDFPDEAVSQPDTITDKQDECPVYTPCTDTPQVTRHDSTLTWSDIVHELKLSGLALSAAEHAELVSKTEGLVTLRIDTNHQSIFTSAVTGRIEQELSRFYGEKISINLNSEVQVSSSPIQQRQAAQKEQIEAAEQALENDSFFQQLKQEFSAEVVKNSIVMLKDNL